jgi:hypothetical protein
MGPQIDHIHYFCLFKIRVKQAMERKEVTSICCNLERDPSSDRNQAEAICLTVYFRQLGRTTIFAYYDYS